MAKTWPKPKPLNPFIVKAKVAEMKAAGVDIGARVRVWWDVDEAYGGGTREHTGVVERLDSMLYVTGSNRSPGHLRLGILGVKSYEVVE